MPMTDLPDFPCPVCHLPMTDVDGLYECQNSVADEEGQIGWHAYSMPCMDEQSQKHDEGQCRCNDLVVNLNAYLAALPKSA